MKKMSTTYGGETAYTLKDISENSGIPVSRLRRHIQEGKLKIHCKTSTYGYIVLQSEVIPYLSEYAKPAEQEMWERLEKEEQVVEPVEPVKVLSIDWDYFIKATADEREFMFPDGGNENLPESVQSTVWASYYGNPQYSLESIKVDKEALKMLRFLLSRQDVKNPPVMKVTDSHKWAYEFIQSHLKTPQQPIVLYNVDYHHDIYDIPGSNEVDCSNWLRKLCEYSNVDAYWVAREDSDPESESQEPLPRATLEDIMDTQFDMVFICRSGMWSPPHLDLEFIRLVSPYVHKWGASVEDVVLKSRYSVEFKRTVAAYKSQLKHLGVL